ncbi:MAG: organic solvent tolerance protein OstA [Cyanobacteria bacterium SBLK]|nr:organic solvent tolerance protein OstA [Cyanobacteria bacterium SBLK]
MNSRYLNLRRFWSIAIAGPLVLAGGGMALWQNVRVAKAQEVGRQIVVRSDIQEANQATGVMTARGNVRIDYPARQMQGTSAQAQYFSNEGVLILTGNAYVLQEGNSVRGEVITYYIEEGRAVATPREDRQVESVYYISDPDAPTSPAKEPALTPYNPKPAFKEPYSDRPPENAEIPQSPTLEPPRVFQPVEEVTPDNGDFPPPPPIEEILPDGNR